MAENGNGNGKLPISKLTGESSDIQSNPPLPDKTKHEIEFEASSMEAVINFIRQRSGTGQLKVNFKNGHARGVGKWDGFLKTNT